MSGSVLLQADDVAEPEKQTEAYNDFVLKIRDDKL